MEIWKDISGFNGDYQVSTMGRVRSFKKIEAILLKPNITKSGYEVVALNKDGKRVRNARVNRLVAETFLPIDSKRGEVNHINGIKVDNRLTNLEYCSRSENMKHAFETGLILPRRGREIQTNKLTEKQVRFIRENHKPYHQILGTKPLAERFGVSRGTITEIAKIKSWIWLLQEQMEG